MKLAGLILVSAFTLASFCHAQPKDIFNALLSALGPPDAQLQPSPAESDRLAEDFLRSLRAEEEFRRRRLLGFSPASGDKNPTGEYKAGTAFSILTNPAAPSSAIIFVAPSTVVTLKCPNGPLGSTVDTCTGTATSPTGAIITVTVKTNAAGTITSVGMTSSSGGNTTTILDPAITVTETISQAPSSVGNPAQTVDPISTATGGLDSGPFIDFSLGGPLPLSLRRFYYSGLGATFGQTGMGYNWTTNFDSYLGISGNFATVALEGGGSVAFQLSGSTYKPVYTPSRYAYQLVKVTSGFRFMNPQTNLIYDFDSNGFLTKIEDRIGNALTLSRGIMGVTQVADGLGRTLTLSYSNASATASITKIADQTGRSVSYTHDALANLTSITDANGNTTANTYSATLGNALAKTTRPLGNAPYLQTFDPNTGAAITQSDSEGDTTKLAYVSGNQPGVTKLTDPLGRVTTFNYADSTLVNLTGITDAVGNSSAATYDSASRPLTFTDRLGNKTSRTYDPASGYLASSTDALGNTTTRTYQSQTQGDFTFYNLAKTTYADGSSDTFTYDNSGNRLTLTDRAGKKTAYTYNAAGQILTETNPAGGVTTNTYNTDGTLATCKIPSGDVTTYTYDNLKRLTKTQYADNTSRSYTYDALDHILSVTDERGNTTKFSYDKNNNLSTVTDALSKSASVSYDTDDLPSGATDRAGNPTTYQVDPLGSVTAITNGASETTTFAYDKLERLQSVADPNSKGPAYGYDAEGRLTSSADAFGNITKLQVDAVGRTTQSTLPLGESTNFTFDSLSRLTGITDALGQQSSIAYDPRGLPNSITSPGGVSVTFTWGDLPLLSSVKDPNGNAWPITRDTLGRITTATDPIGNTLKYTYDSRGRVSTVTSPADSAQFTYDAAGNLSKAQYSDNSSFSYTYDPDNRLTGGTGVSLTYDANGRVIGSNGLTLTRDPAGRISSITYAPGKTVTLTYDSRGLLSRISDWANGGMVFNFDDAHRMISQRASNGVLTGYNYDKDSRVTGISFTGGLLSLGSIAITRDATGRISSANRKQPQDLILGTSTTARSFDSASQIVGATYDARGRLTDDGAGDTYNWTPSSRLSSYIQSNASAGMTYDALGQRISRTSGSATQNYVIDYATGLPSIATIKSGTTDVRYFVYTPDGLLLYSIEAASGAHHYYAFDETGSTLFLTDKGGQVTDSYGISPYGDAVTVAPYNTADNPFTWQGQYGVMQEPGTKLFYARDRYFDGTSQRFISRDPIFSAVPAEIDPYQYAAGDPVGNHDPTGLKLFTPPDREAENRRLENEFQKEYWNKKVREPRPVPAPPPASKAAPPPLPTPAISIIREIFPSEPAPAPILPGLVPLVM